MRGRYMIATVVAVTLAGCGNGYSHVVDKPQSEVVAALEDLDFETSTDFAGPNLNTATGAKPDIRLEKAADHMTWWVMAGDKVAMTMTANFESLDGGKRTRVTTAVARGDAPDAMVAPVFQSTGAASGLFSVAVDTELNDMLTPSVRASASAAECAALMERFRDENMADPDLQRRPDGFGQAVGQAGRTIARLREMEAEARRRGCRTDGGQFRPVSSEMKPADEDEDRPLRYPRSSKYDEPDTSADGIPDN